MNIYVASSWRNPYQPLAVEALRLAGHDVYDFRNPAPGDEGFTWKDIDPNFPKLTLEGYVKALDHPLAVSGFESDMKALRAADLAVLLQPCGRSAFWEYGWWCAKAGRPGIVLCPGLPEPELMLRGSIFVADIVGLRDAVKVWAEAAGRAA